LKEGELYSRIFFEEEGSGAKRKKVVYLTEEIRF